MSRLKLLSERFGYLAGYQEWAEELAKMDKKLDRYADLERDLDEATELLRRAKCNNANSFIKPHDWTTQCDAFLARHRKDAKPHTKRKDRSESRVSRRN